MRRTRLTPLLWFQTQVGIHPVKVYLSTDRTSPELRGCVGHTSDAGDGLVVLLDATRDWAAVETTCLHELQHCALWHQSEDVDDQEETFVEITSLALAPLLRSMGLRFPRKPRGFTALLKTAQS